MERVIVAHVDHAASSRAVVDWASQEATRRAVPLRVIHHWKAALLDEANLIVAGTRELDTVACSTCPVVLVPEESTAPGLPQHVAEIALGVDARGPAQGAVAFAFDTARVWSVRLRAVHAWRFPSCAAELPFGIPEEDRAAWEDQEVQLLSDVLRPWREKYPEVYVMEDVRLFIPEQALLQRSGSAGLVVVGRRAGDEPGAVVRAIVRDGLCPVAVVPS